MMGPAPPIIVWPRVQPVAPAPSPTQTPLAGPLLMDAVIEKIVRDPKLTKAVLLQLMGMLSSTDDSQIGKINQMNQVSLKLLSKLVEANERVDSFAQYLPLDLSKLIAQPAP